MRYDSPAVNWWAARDACLNEGHDVRLATFKTSAAAEFLINDHNADKNSKYGFNPSLYYPRDRVYNQ